MAKTAALKAVDDAPKGKSPQEWAKYWQKEMDAAHKRLRTFRKQGVGVVDRYRNEKNTTDTAELAAPDRNLASLNLFWSNITTLQSMLYGATPQADVSREHHDPDDDIARVACLLYQRILQADFEGSDKDVPTSLKAALQDRLLPGLGVCKVSYKLETNAQNETTYEYACADYVHWQDVAWGWGRTFSEIPWFAFRNWLDKDEVKKRFPKVDINQLNFTNQTPESGDDTTTASPDDQRDSVQKAEIWEIWNKKDKTVYYYSKGVDLILDITADPLKLDGFWPIPRPMTANLTTTIFTPKADFCMAQDLYNEIDILQARISLITSAIKVVGVYDSAAGTSVGRMLQEGTENTLIPVDNWAMFMEKGGLKGVIDWYPVEQVVNTLNVLIQSREQNIALLHEITGMSDLIRGGSTDQYTSDGTNQLKAKFGSIRVQALQDEFARFASDLEALKAEVISKHYSAPAILQQSNAEYMPEADKDKVLPAVQLMKSPTVKWRVSIRPESIAMIDYAQLKSERTEFLTAVATFLQSANSILSVVPEATPMLLEFLKFGMVGFRGANYMEGILDQAIDMAKKAPPKPQDDGKAQAEAARAQADMAKIQAKLEADLQVIGAKQQAEMQKLQIDGANNMREILAKAQGDQQKIMTDLRADLQVIAAKLGADLQVERAQSTYAVAEMQTEHANATQLEQQQHADAMAQGRQQAANRPEPGSAE